MAQLAGAGSIMDEFNSAFRQVLPSPQLASSYLGNNSSCNGYTPSLLSAPTVAPTSIVSPPPQPACAAPPGYHPPPPGKGGAWWLKVLGWLGVAVVGVIIIAVFLRQRMFVRVESTNAVPLITDQMVFVDHHVDADTKPEVIPRVELVEEEEAQRQQQDAPAAARRVHFEDEVEEEDAGAALDMHDTPVEHEDEDHNENDDMSADPNFTPMKLDAIA